MAESVVGLVVTVEADYKLQRLYSNAQHQIQCHLQKTRELRVIKSITLDGVKYSFKEKRDFILVLCVVEIKSF